MRERIEAALRAGLEADDLTIRIEDATHTMISLQKDEGDRPEQRQIRRGSARTSSHYISPQFPSEKLRPIP